jgi:sortase A
MLEMLHATSTLNRRLALPRLDVTEARTWLLLIAIHLIALGVLFAGHGLYIRAKAEFAQILLEDAWTKTLATHQPTKAWSWADTWPVARITVPRLSQSAIVLKDAGGEALAFGPAHVASSPMPGESGTTVIAAHRDTHFTFLKNLKPGDEIDITTSAGATIRYRMTDAKVVHAQASGIVTKGKTQRLALVTCYPFDGLQRGPLRYVVFAERIAGHRSAMIEGTTPKPATEP